MAYGVLDSEINQEELALLGRLQKKVRRREHYCNSGGGWSIIYSGLIVRLNILPLHVFSACRAFCSS